MITVTNIRHAYPESDGFKINRKNGLKEFTFLHFLNSVKILYNGKLQQTAPGAVIIFNQDTPQYFESIGSLVHNWMHFTGDPGSIMEMSGLKTDTVYYPDGTDFITAIAKEMETEFFSSHENKNYMLQLKFEELIIKIGRRISGASVPEFSTETSEKFRYLRGKMFSCLQEKWTVERMASEVGYSVPRFLSIYKSIYGISPAADLINVRIDNAKNMLCYQKKSVKEISAALGYDNLTHFIRQFHSRTGVSPCKYRKNNSSSS